MELTASAAKVCRRAVSYTHLATAAPEATAEPEAAPKPAAQSADIPEEYQGTWYGLNMELDGEAYPLADLGLDVTVTIGADGTAEMNMGGDVDHLQCAMQDGALVAGTMVFTLRDGVLSLSEDGAMMTLSREKPEAAGEMCIRDRPMMNPMILRKKQRAGT